jgi:two-component system sensor histidine kinase ChvG
MEPLKRNISSQDHRAQRAAQLIESSLSRLSTLVTTAQRLGNDTADFIEAPKRRINLTRIVTDELLQCRDLAAGRGLRFIRRIEDRVLVLSPEGILDVLVENILDNAISFSPENGTIVLTLTKSKDRVDLKIEDEGPGIDQAKIDRIFERYFSLRPVETPEEGDHGDGPEHAGLGLWIVRRSAEALGGGVIAANRVGGGLCVHVTLPSAD